MKSLLSFVWILAAGCLSASAQLVTGNELVRVEVRVDSEQERKDLAKTTTDKVTQRKKLHITLSGKPKSPDTRIGKWTAFGEAAKGDELTVLESGEFKVDLSDAMRSQTIESKFISTTYTPEHSKVSRPPNVRKRINDVRTKKVPASGMKFVGYAVVIRDGDKIVGEYYDPPGLKQQVAK